MSDAKVRSAAAQFVAEVERQPLLKKQVIGGVPLVALEQSPGPLEKPAPTYDDIVDLEARVRIAGAEGVQSSKPTEKVTNQSTKNIRTLNIVKMSTGKVTNQSTKNIQPEVYSICTSTYAVYIWL